MTDIDRFKLHLDELYKLLDENKKLFKTNLFILCPVVILLLITVIEVYIQSNNNDLIGIIIWILIGIINTYSLNSNITQIQFYKQNIDILNNMIECTHII